MKARAHTLFQQTLLGDAAEHAEIGIMVWNEERRYVAVNRFACQMLGVTREELLGSQVGDQNPTAAARERSRRRSRSCPPPVARRSRTASSVDWMTMASDVAGLPHILGLMWEARDPTRKAPRTRKATLRWLL